MEKPKFNNTPNDHIIVRSITSRGSTSVDAWISRSVAVVGIVFMILDNSMKVLVTKRSKRMMDEGGKHCIPCGYLDWDETAYDAMVREVYEETSLYLPKYKDFLISNNNEKPFTIVDNPHSKRQNVSLIYLSIYDMNLKPDLFPNEVSEYSDNETSEVQWMTIADFYHKYDKQYQWAFNHNDMIKDAVKHFNKI